MDAATVDTLAALTAVSARRGRSADGHSPLVTALNSEGTSACDASFSITAAAGTVETATTLAAPHCLYVSLSVARALPAIIVRRMTAVVRVCAANAGACSHHTAKQGAVATKAALLATGGDASQRTRSAVRHCTSWRLVTCRRGRAAAYH
jgi:hypothetical protein